MLSRRLLPDEGISTYRVSIADLTIRVGRGFDKKPWPRCSVLNESTAECGVFVRLFHSPTLSLSDRISLYAEVVAFESSSERRIRLV